MDKLEYVIKKLSNKKTHAEAAFKTGLSTRTFSNILNGKNVYYNTVIALYEHYKGKSSKG